MRALRAIPALIALTLTGCGSAAAPPAARSELALLTSLPILFGEAFSLDQPRSSLLAALEERFAVRAVDGPEQLSAGGILLAVQPQALTAERLVALDAWVRAGGRMVLLADPRLAFDSERPLGDRFRPPLRYPDEGLLQHWGLRFDSATDSPAEAVDTDLGRGIRAAMSGAGALVRSGGACTLTPTRVAARCRVGRGYVTIVADADFALVPDAGGDANRAALVALVAELDPRG